MRAVFEALLINVNSKVCMVDEKHLMIEGYDVKKAGSSLAE